jgi:hypothetical protein
MDAEGWLTSELATFTCAACGQAYGESHVRLIARREELFFVDLSCPHCGSQAVAIVTIQLESESVPEGGRLVASGLGGGGDEPAAPPISVDDVLDMHGLLADFRGDVHELMARFDGSRERAPEHRG